MYYIIKKGCELFDQLNALNVQIKEDKKYNSELVKELGGKDWGRNERVLNQIAAIEFDSKPEGWRVVGEPYQKFFLPKMSGVNAAKLKEHKAIYEKINLRPAITRQAISRMVGYRSIFGNPGVNFGPEFHLVAYPDKSDKNDAKPVKGMKEILGSRYTKLKAELDKKESDD